MWLLEKVFNRIWSSGSTFVVGVAELVATFEVVESTLTVSEGELDFWHFPPGMGAGLLGTAPQPRLHKHALA
jgi:hypothetical protein